MRRVLLAVIEYLLGFLALAFFAFLAFASPNPTDERPVIALSWLNRLLRRVVQRQAPPGATARASLLSG